jgi:ParB family chromosome partitioning protein
MKAKKNVNSIAREESRSSSTEPTAKGTGGPLMIDIDLIDEDPEQPRTKDNPGFAAESISELAASFGPNGPKSPISLRVNPAKPGRYLINHGARRTRAGRVIGMTKMPAFIDNDYREIDQVIENLQRDNLTPREIADWIGRELARGMKKGEIAKAVGKSAAFVSQHANLLNLPAAIDLAFNSGRTNDVTVINELVTAFKKNPNEVTAWLAEDRREITRGGVKMLREFLDEKSDGDVQGPAPELLSPDGNGIEPLARTMEKRTRIEHDDSKLKKPLVLVEYKGRTARLLFSRRPSTSDDAWLKAEDDGSEFEVKIGDVKLISITEGKTTEGAVNPEGGPSRPTFETALV